MRAALRVEGITHRFGELVAVEDVSFAVAEGSVTALLGPTGCGKSTILRIAAGLLTPTHGRVDIGGTDRTGRPGAARYMPQGDSLFPWRRAGRNATLGLRIRGTRRSEADARARALFARFGLVEFMDAWPHQLSGGMRQRVALLRTVLAGIGPLLLDEPFGALDAITRTDLHGWLSELIHIEGLTCVIVTHDVDEALRLADDVLVLTPRPGRVRLRVAVPVARAARTAEDVALPDFAMLKRRLLGALGAG